MAAPISPISVAAPAELIAPQAVTNSVNKSAFKSELSTASNSVNGAKNGRQDTAGNHRDTDKTTSKSTNKDGSQVKEQPSSSALKSSAKDTNLARAEALQQSRAESDAAATNAVDKNRESSDQSSQITETTGQELPSNGETLPPTNNLSTAEVAAAVVNANQSAGEAGLANSAATGEQAQLLTSELLARLVTAAPGTDPSVNVPASNALGAEQVPAQLPKQAITTVATTQAAEQLMVDSLVGKTASGDSKVAPNASATAVVPNPLGTDTKISDIQKPVQAATKTSLSENKAVVSASASPGASSPAIDTKAAAGLSVEPQVKTNIGAKAPVAVAQPTAAVTPTTEAVNRETILASAGQQPNAANLQEQPSAQVGFVDRDSARQPKVEVTVADGRSNEDIAVQKSPAVSVNNTALDNKDLAVVNNTAALNSEAVLVAGNRQEAQQAQPTVNNNATVEAMPVVAPTGPQEIASKAQPEQSARPASSNPDVAQSQDGKKTAEANPPIAMLSAKVAPSSAELSVALNQSLEKLRSGIETAAANKNGDEAAEVKTSSAKILANTDTLQQLTSLQQNLRTTSPVQMQMPTGTTPAAQNWGRAVADKVFIAASQNLRVANIQLDPPELGALQIRLQITGPDQQMSVSFSSPHAAVRDVLEQQLPRLREMLAEQGINLGESSVSDQGANNNQGSESSESQGSGQYAQSSENEEVFNPLNTQGTVALVDFYA
ncbi:MAG: flagellar hook-length control protein FliK [Pseudomonadales bacterium]|nr:flagellar hook-length control protein FliK [Pseudomonadales bacterium]NRA18040.1 flagellar hook-length control protein FliK [Oceanospirillaceae bacterium]